VGPVNVKGSGDRRCAVAERGAAAVAVDVDESGGQEAASSVHDLRSRRQPQVGSWGSALACGRDGLAIEQDPAVLADKSVGDDEGGVDQCAWHQATMTSMP